MKCFITSHFLSFLFIVSVFFALNATAQSVIADIPVARPAGIVVNEQARVVYVADTGTYPDGTGRIRVIDEGILQVTDAIITTGNTAGVGFNFRTNRLYTTDLDNQLLDVIDSSTGQVISTVALAGSCGDVKVNTLTNKIYVSCRFIHTVQIIDGSTNTVLATLPVPAPERIGVNEATNLIYVAANPTFTRGTVYVIDGSGDRVNTIIDTGRMTTGIAINSGTNTIYASNHDSGDVSVIDGNSNMVVATINLGQQLTGADLDPATRRLYVDEAPFDQPGGVAVIDEDTYKVLRSVPVGTLPQYIAIDSSTRLAFVGNFLSRTVSVISLDQ